MSPAKLPKHRQCGVQQVNERLTEQDPAPAREAARGSSTSASARSRRARRSACGASWSRCRSSCTSSTRPTRRTSPTRRSRARSTCSTRTTAAPTPTARTSPTPGRAWPPTRTSSSSSPRSRARRPSATRSAPATPSSAPPTAAIDPRPTTKFLNVWVCNLGEGLLGYAQFPGGPAKTDGVVILYTAFGTTGAARRAVQPRPHRHPRGRPLAQPPPHLGRQDRLLGLRPGVRHPEGADAQLRHAHVARTSPATTAPTATCS